MQIKQFQFGTQNETKTSIFYISGKVLALPTPRASPKYPAVPLPPLSFSVSLACWPSNCRRKNNHFGIFACSSRTRSPTDGQPWMDWLRLRLGLLLQLLLWFPNPPSTPPLCLLLLLACELSLAWFILKLQANNFEIEATFLKLLQQSAESHRPTVCLAVSCCLSRSVSVSVRMSQGAGWVPLGLLHKQSYCQVSISGVSNFVAFR